MRNTNSPDVYSLTTKRIQHITIQVLIANYKKNYKKVYV